MHRAVLVLLGLLAACGSKLDITTRPIAQLNAGIVVDWMDLLQTAVVRNEGLPPTSASRLYAYASIALYEGCIVGDPTYRSLAGQLNGLAALPAPDPLPSAATPYDPAAVANRACAVVVRGIAPGMYLPTSTTGPFANQAINSMEQTWNAYRQNAVPMDVWTRSNAYGDALGTALLAWANADNFATVNAAQNTYVPPIGMGLWIPTPPQFRRALQPAWGTMRTFVLTTSDEAAAPAPPPFSTDPASPFYAYAREVFDAVVNGTQEERDIAFFWADDPGLTSTPPGHWVNIVSLLALEDDLPLNVAAEAYARVGLAAGDAFIACWRIKYLHNVLRPITYIQTYLDDQWLPLVGTPPFPTYASGHSTVSGTAATVLTALFGVRSFTDWTHTPRGIPPRFFDSFEDAAQEAADSRLYAGIHYRFDDDEGLFHGQRIGQLINERVTFRN